MELETSPTAGRRQAAPHPGPMIVREHLEPLRLDAPSLAACIGMDAQRLRSMLDGSSSIDVETAVRLSRALQLNPKLLMELQLRHDFARARADRALETIPVLENDGRLPFPATGFLRGRLSGLRDPAGFGDVRFETLGFFAEPGQDVLACMHPIEAGVRLRVYGEDGGVLWTGVVLVTLEGRPLLPYARPNTWIEWFANRARADYIAAPARHPAIPAGHRTES